MGWERADATSARGLTPLLEERFSTRVFDPGYTLGVDDLRPLLEAARWAPSAGNSQPWAFLVGLRDDETHRAFVPLLSRGNAFWVPRASAVIITLHRSATDPGSDMLYSDYAAYDLGQSVAHLTVQALAAGLQVHQFAGFDHAATALAFGVPDNWTVTTAVAIGRPAPVESIEDAEPSLAQRERRLRDRNPLQGFVFAGTFGSPAEIAPAPGSR
ncbi:nitroreductase family protein [Nakamurella sp. A5-74]|uniref:Nitroreductase family protein n=1 Tax=Nakamurella sp. A5-74 TaxID=3158264 RepID=A0AAU8DPK5_9ACTN